MSHLEQLIFKIMLKALPKPRVTLAIYFGFDIILAHDIGRIISIDTCF
ncbi:hypothetical protein RCH20_000650 [Psychrobacter sp. PL15]|nr:hypothetical protein [Psychrobacter sp. PL15]